MTLPTIHIGDPRTTFLGDAAAAIAISDERGRPEQLEAPISAIASITLSSQGTDSTWGEFLQYADVLALHAWTGEMIRDHRETPRSQLAADPGAQGA